MSEAKTKTVDGEVLHSSDFAYVGDPDDISTWHLPINNAGRVHAALSRFNQTALPAVGKAEAARKIVTAAHKYNIDTTGFESEHKVAASAVIEYFLPAIELDSDAAGAPRADGLFRVPVIKLGHYVQGTKKLAITPELVKQMTANFAAQAVDVPMSYDHTIEHPLAAQGNPIPAAGWIKELDATPDASGVLWGWAQLTDRARQLIASKEYRYTSPAYSVHYPNHKTGKDQGATLLSLGLTNRPFLPMPALTLSVVLPAAEETDQVSDEIPPAGKPKGATPMAFNKVKVSPITTGDQKGHVLVEHDDFPKQSPTGEAKQYYADADEAKAALSAAGDTKPDEASAARLGKIVLLSGVAASGVTDEVVTALATKIAASANRGDVVTLSAVPVEGGKRNYAALSVPDGALVDGAVFRTMHADLELDAAVAAGKVLPAQRADFARVAERDLDLFRVMLRAMPRQVQYGVALGSGASGAETAELSADEIAIAKQLGNDPKQVLESKRRMGAGR